MERKQSETVGSNQTLNNKVIRLEQQLADKEIQITDKDTHLKSLEEKHQHAQKRLNTTEHL